MATLWGCQAERCIWSVGSSVARLAANVRWKDRSRLSAQRSFSRYSISLVVLRTAMEVRARYSGIFTRPTPMGRCAEAGAEFSGTGIGVRTKLWVFIVVGLRRQPASRAPAAVTRVRRRKGAGLMVWVEEVFCQLTGRWDCVGGIQRG